MDDRVFCWRRGLVRGISIAIPGSASAGAERTAKPGRGVSSAANQTGLRLVEIAPSIAIEPQGDRQSSFVHQDRPGAMSPSTHQGQDRPRIGRAPAFAEDLTLDRTDKEPVDNTLTFDTACSVALHWFGLHDPNALVSSARKYAKAAAKRVGGNISGRILWQPKPAARPLPTRHHSAGMPPKDCSDAGADICRFSSQSGIRIAEQKQRARQALAECWDGTGCGSASIPVAHPLASCPRTAPPGKSALWMFT